MDSTYLHLESYTDLLPPFLIFTFLHLLVISSANFTISEGKMKSSQFFKRITEWRRKLDSFHEGAIIRWSEPHLSAVCAYILQLGNINSEFKLLKKVPSDFHHSRAMITSFMQALQEIFTVPKLNYGDLYRRSSQRHKRSRRSSQCQLYGEDKATVLKKTELFAVFINFLLHLLYHKTELTDSYEDKIDVLRKELRFLFIFLGDSLLLDVELQGVVNVLLPEFEDVANEAGSLMFHFTFTVDRAIMARTMDWDFGALLKRINDLKGTITEFSIQLPQIRNDNITSKTASKDLLFIVDPLLYDLEDLMNREDDPIADVKGQIKILHQGLLLSKSLLKDIRVQGHSEIQELKGIVIRIRDVAYEAEYLINSYLSGDNPHWYFTIRLPDVTRKIKLIGAELQDFKESFDIGASKVAMDYSSLPLQAKRNFEVDDNTVGLEDEETYILDQLVGGRENLKIISIFGMPGLGKTTLAKQLYNHPSVNYYFDKCSWCVVSQTYQRKKLLIGILISLGSELEKVKIMDMEEESMGECIYKSLKGRRCLIVMDDVWDSNVWDDLRRYFPDDGNGSRILFTSRNKDVAPPNSIIYGLPFLSNDQCWELLHKKVFHNKPCPPQLLHIGKKIAANCNGLPLAVVVIAGILSTMVKKKSTWEKIGESVGSHIFSDENNSMMQILKFSYKHLPNHLKPCFLYFGAFPEDTEIPVNKLINFWIAEGFICKEENKSTESVGEDYLTELIDRSLVIVAKRRSDGRAKACVVHDLLRDMCLRVAEKKNFLKLIDDNYSVYTKHHRLHIHNKPYPRAPCKLFLSFGPHLRSLFVSRRDSSSLNFFDMKLLRVLLSLSHVDGIEHLVNLRYLAIEYMPASIDSLVNLEFLTVHKLLLYGGQRSIPSLIQNMVKLRYLKVPLAKFDEDWNISKTNNLEFLSTVKIYELKDEEKLRCLPHLRRLKCQCRPFRDEKSAYRYPDLRFLTQLESLNMTAFHGRARAEINFPANIKKLSLEGLLLPWEKMSIIGGLPNLQVLKLGRHTFIGKVWETRDGEFQQLRFLKIYGLLYLEKWSVASGEHFPKLQHLILQRCFKLEEIPSEMGEIATLQSIEVKQCPKIVGESAVRIQEEQRDLGNEELRVIIVNQFDLDG